MKNRERKLEEGWSHLGGG